MTDCEYTALKLENVQDESLMWQSLSFCIYNRNKWTGTAINSTASATILQTCASYMLLLIRRCNEQYCRYMRFGSAHFLTSADCHISSTVHKRVSKCVRLYSLYIVNDSLDFDFSNTVVLIRIRYLFRITKIDKSTLIRFTDTRHTRWILMKGKITNRWNNQ